MDGSPSSVLSAGFGTWGSTGLVLTLGLGVGAGGGATASWQYAIFAGNKGHIAFAENKGRLSFAGNKGHVESNDQP